MTDQQIEIGIFGGTGIYDSGLLENSKEITIETPYGKTSDTITIGQYNDRNIAFLPRLGNKHTIPPFANGDNRTITIIPVTNISVSVD